MFFRCPSNALLSPTQYYDKLLYSNKYYLLKKKKSAFSALAAKTFKYYLLSYHRKLSVQLLRDSYVVIILIVKVNYAVTLNASEMMMGVHIRIIPLRLPVPLNYICNTNFRESQESPVDSIK